MSLVFTILVGLLVLVGLIATFMTIKSWHWAQMLLMLGIFMTSVGVLLLSSEVLRIHKLLRTNIAKREAELETVETSNRALTMGTRNDPTVISGILNDLRNPDGIASRLPADESLQPLAEGLRQLAGNEPAMARLNANIDKLAERSDLPSLEVWSQQNAILARQRGRVWRGAAPAGPIDATGRVQATIPAPRPHGVEKGAVVYVFEMGEPNALNPAQAAQYLGEFRVVEAAGDGVSLVPVLPPDPRSMQRLMASKGPWSIYETMPADRHELFGKYGDDGEWKSLFSAEQMKRMFPPASLEEYVRHGGEATVNDDELHRQKFDEQGHPIGPESDEKVDRERYNRPLRAYEVLFNRLAEKRVGIISQLAAEADKVAKLNETETKGQQLKSERTAEKEKLSVDMQRMSRDLETIRKLHATIASQLQVAQQAIVDGLSANAQLAAELTRRQLAFLGASAP